MSMPSVLAHRLARQLALLPWVWLAVLSLSAQAAPIERSQALMTLSPGRSVLSPYVDLRSGDVVVHVQPALSTQPEQLIDARSGRAWAGDLGRLLRDFTHLDSESVAGVARGTAPDLVLLRALGCGSAYVMCTSMLDADVLLLAAPEGSDQLRLTVIDLRPPLAEMEALLAGRLPVVTSDWGDDEWRVFALAAQRPERRARWVDALRSISSIDGFQNVVAHLSAGARLGARRLFQGADAAVDLRSELELLGHRLLVGAHADALLADAGPQALSQAQSQLADALEAASQPPNQIGVATHLVDLLSNRPAAQRERLATGIAAEAGRRRSEVLHCFAQWLSSLPCGDSAPPWVQREPPQAAAPAARRTPAQPSQPKHPSSQASAVAAAGTASANPARGEGAGDAPHEWTLIQAVPNKLVLVSFNEASGRMVPDRAVVGGFSFVARALGPVQDGRFEVEIASPGGSPVQLRYGQYRVRARLVLDYTREDQCVQGMSCWFSGPELHAKSVPRDVVFFMTVAGRFVDRRRTEFGSLLPLLADGPARYRSQLKEARLAVESVRFELL